MKHGRVRRTSPIAVAFAGMTVLLVAQPTDGLQSGDLPQFLQEASDAARQIEDENRRIDALTQIAAVQVHANQQVNAEATFNLARELAGQTDYPHDRSRGLLAIAKARVLAHQRCQVSSPAGHSRAGGGRLRETSSA